MPLSLYFKDGNAKVEIAVARGKKSYDKRQALAERDAKRETDRAMRQRERELAALRVRVMRPATVSPPRRSPLALLAALALAVAGAAPARQAAPGDVDPVVRRRRSTVRDRRHASTCGRRSSTRFGGVRPPRHLPEHPGARTTVTTTTTTDRVIDDQQRLASPARPVRPTEAQERHRDGQLVLQIGDPDRTVSGTADLRHRLRRHAAR